MLAYFERPDKFVPAKGSLLGYLYLDAFHDLLNLIKQQEKFVELRPLLPEHEVQAVEAENPETRLLTQDSPLVRRALDSVTSPVDRDLLELMLEGVRETAAYSVVLGITDRRPREQAQVVKRHKDRLKKTLQRVLKRKSR